MTDEIALIDGNNPSSIMNSLRSVAVIDDEPEETVAEDKGGKIIEPPSVEVDEDEEEIEEEGEEDEDDSDEDSEDAEDSNEDSEDADEPDSEPKKVIKAKVGSKEVSLNADAKIKVKVDGKEEEITLQDAINDYSGRTAIARQFSQIDKEKKTVQKAREEFDKDRQDIALHLELMTTLEGPEFIRHFAQLKGKDPEQVYAQFIQAVIKEQQELQSLTPQERELKRQLKRFETEQKITSVHNQLDQQRQAEAQKQQTLQQRQQKTYSQLEAYEIPKDEFLEGFKKLEKLIEDGQLPSDREYDEFDVIHFVREGRVLTLIDESVNNLVKSPTTEYKKRIRVAIDAEERYRERPLKESEIKMIVSQLVGKDKKTVQENLSKKAAIPAKSEKVRSRAEVDDDKILSPLDILGRIR